MGVDRREGVFQFARPTGALSPGAADEHHQVPFRATDAGRSYGEITRLPLVVMLVDVRSAYNVGAFFRTADAARVAELILVGITAAPPHRGIAKTALGAERTVPWRRVEDAATELTRLREGGYEIAAIETTTQAIDLFDWCPAFPVCVLFGHEVDGLPASILERCDRSVRIPTLGAKASLNVATAGGVVIYELLRQYRERLLVAAGARHSPRVTASAIGTRRLAR